MLSPRVDELLSEWEARREAGDAVRAEDLCAGDPQLLEEVRWAIHALEEVESRFGVAGAEDPESVSSSTAALPVRDVDVNSRFRIERLHASGGLGRVYVAWDQHLHRRVAIKFPIGSKLTEQARRRFRREVDVTSRLDHPGVVPVHSLDDGDDGRLPCYVMRFVEGQTLHEAIEASRSAEVADSKARQSTAWAVDTDPATPDDVPETGPLHRPAGTLDLTDLLQRFVTVCNIAGYAHSRGVIHRDIKPSNILLGDFGETLLLDWGLARVVGTADFEPVAADHLKSQVSNLKSIAPGSGLRPALPGLADEPGPAGVSAGAEAAEIALQAANSRLTVSGQVLGTPAFASPEQLLGDPSSLTARSDVYSLGATLFRILTGESLVRPDELPQYLEQLKSGTVSGVVSRMAHVPAALSAICGKALAVDPLQRYAAATELARDVERYLRDEPVSVSREPIWRRFLRWLRRHPRLSSSCAAALMAGFGVALLASLVLGRKNEQLSAAIDEAEAGRTQAINALRSLSDNVLASVLQQNTRLTRQQTSYLERVASQYSAFASATGDRPDALLLKAEGFAQCGAIHCALRQMPQAERELSAAIGILQSLDADDVGLDVRTRLVSALLAQAACYSRQYQYDAARRSLQEALDVTDAAITAGAMDDRPLRLLRGQVLERQARNFADLGMYVDSAECGQRAESCLEPLVASGWEHPELVLTLAKIASVLDDATYEAADAGTARKSLERSRQLWQSLLDNDPTDADRQIGLAGCEHSLVRLLGPEGRFQEVDECCSRGIALAEQAASRFPAVMHYRRTWLRLLAARSAARWQLGQVPESRSDLALALELGRSLPAESFHEPRERFSVYWSQFQVLLHADVAEDRIAAESFGRKFIADLKRAALEVEPRFQGEYRQLLGQSAMILSMLRSNSGDQEEAEELANLAINVLEDLFDSEPPNLKVGPDLADACRIRAKELRRHREFAKSRELLERAAQVLQQSNPAGLQNFRTLRNRVALTSDFGLLLEAEGNQTAAEKHYRDAIAIRLKLLELSPSSVRLQVQLAGDHCNLANALNDPLRPELAAAAVTEYDRAVEQLTTIMVKQPAYSDARTYMRNARAGRGNALMDVGRYEESVADFDWLQADSAAQFNATMKINRARSLAYINPAAAVNDAKAIQPATGDHTYSAIALAAVFALAAEHTDDAIVRRDGQSRAMELLLAMEAAGQLNSALNKGRLRKATDLNGLRDLPEFEELKRRVVGDESPVQP